MQRDKKEESSWVKLKVFQTNIGRPNYSSVIFIRDYFINAFVDALIWKSYYYIGNHLF